MYFYSAENIFDDSTVFSSLRNGESCLERGCITSASKIIEIVVLEYLQVRKYDFGREFTRIKILQGKPSKRHQLRKLTDYRNQ